MRLISSESLLIINMVFIRVEGSYSEGQKIVEFRLFSLNFTSKYNKDVFIS